MGYDHDELAGLYRLRMEKACQSDYAVLFWLRDIREPDSFVFDFGGHVGVSYYGWRNYLRYPPGTRWLVHDVPAIISSAPSLPESVRAPHSSSPATSPTGATATSSWPLARCSTSTSLAAILARVGSRPHHLIINKMPLYDGETFVTVQSTGRAFHAYRIHNREEFVKA